MTAHMRRHTGQKYTCTQCEKRFSSQTALCHHKNIHTGKYKCTECDKCCKSSRDLARHRRLTAKPILVCLMANAHYKTQTYRPTDNA